MGTLTHDLPTVEKGAAAQDAPAGSPGGEAPATTDDVPTNTHAAPATTRVSVQGFGPGADAAVVDRFVAIGAVLQGMTLGRVVADMGTTAYRLSRDFPFYGYGDARHFVAGLDSVDMGRCSAIINHHARTEAGEPVGYVGMWECDDDDAVAHALLDTAVSWLLEQGCAEVYGPLDFSTWYQYRHTLGPLDGNPILLEPYTPAHYDRQWRSFGFELDQSYFSAVCDRPQQMVEYGEPSLHRAMEAGFRVEQLRMSHFEEALESVYELSRSEFADNPHYTPIGREEFHALYAGSKDSIDPRLMLFAIAPDGDMAGFVFCVPNYVRAAQALQGTSSLPRRLRALSLKRHADSVLVKTVAVSSRYRSHGLGTVLIACAHQAAIDLGYPQVHHVLMHENNHSSRISANAGAETMRRYGLYRLAGQTSVTDPQ